MGFRPASSEYAIAWGTKMIPITNPDIMSPQMYSLHWYLGSHCKTGKKSMTKFFSFFGVQEQLFCSVASMTSFLLILTRVFLSMRKQGEVLFSILVASSTLSIVPVFTSCGCSCNVKKTTVRLQFMKFFFFLAQMLNTRRLLPDYSFKEASSQQKHHDRAPVTTLKYKSADRAFSCRYLRVHLIESSLFY